MSDEIDGPFFLMTIRGQEDSYPELLDVSTFLYDLNLLYEISRLATDPKYYLYDFTSHVYRRNGRTIKDADKLRIVKLRHESPIEMVVIVTATAGAIGAIWGVVQIIDKIVNIPLNRRKLKAEVEKLEYEKAQRQEKVEGTSYIDNPQLYERKLRDRAAEEYYRNTGRRIISAKVRIKEFEVKYIETIKEVDGDNKEKEKSFEKQKAKQ